MNECNAIEYSTIFFMYANLFVIYNDVQTYNTCDMLKQHSWTSTFVGMYVCDFEITDIHYDGAAKGKLRDLTNRNIHPPGRHVAKAERAVRTMKEQLCIEENFKLP